MRPRIPNSFGVPAHAERLISVEDRARLMALRRELIGQTVLLLGDGSNVLFAADPPGVVLLNRLRGIELHDGDGDLCRLQVAAGESWDGLVRWCGDRGLWGIENLALIPGRVGAAPIQNIGAYGVEFSEVCEAVEVIDRAGQASWLPAAACDFGYRDSLFKGDGRELWISAVRLRLWRQPRPRLSYAGIAEELADRGIESTTPVDIAEAVRAIRRRKLPDPATMGNAGSFFKNPLVDSQRWRELSERLAGLPGWPAGQGRVKLSAAWLIEAAGWKGARRGDAGVAPGHALVLVNHGHASGAELLALAREIQADVQERYGISLEPEPQIIAGPRQGLSEAL